MDFKGERWPTSGPSTRLMSLAWGVRTLVNNHNNPVIRSADIIDGGTAHRLVLFLSAGYCWFIASKWVSSPYIFNANHLFKALYEASLLLKPPFYIYNFMIFIAFKNFALKFPTEGTMLRAPPISIWKRAGSSRHFFLHLFLFMGTSDFCNVRVAKTSWGITPSVFVLSTGLNL